MDKMMSEVDDSGSKATPAADESRATGTADGQTHCETADERMLFKDYDAARAFVDKMDGQLFAIRNLAIVSASAIAAFAVSQHRPRVVLANTLVVPSFMLLEFVYKCFHEDGIRRVWRLETLIQEYASTKTLPKDYFFGIGHAIRPVSLAALVKLLTHAGRWHIRLLYLLLVLMSAATYWLATAAV